MHHYIDKYFIYSATIYKSYSEQPPAKSLPRVSVFSNINIRMLLEMERRGVI